MSPDHLKEFWHAIAHQINNATANIMLETSTLQFLIEKKDLPKEQIIQILKYLDTSVEMVTASLIEMETIWEQMEKGQSLDLKTWEADFRRHLQQIKAKDLLDKK